MRQWIKLVESFIKTNLNEKNYSVDIERPKGVYNNIDVLESPNTTQLLNFINKSKYGEVKGLVSNDAVYLWDGEFANHDDMRRPLGLSSDIADIFIDHKNGKYYIRGFRNAKLGYPNSGIDRIFNSDDIIKEKSFDLDVHPLYTNITKIIEVLEKPTPKELLSFLRKTEYDEVKGLVTNDNVYLWDSNHATHHEVKKDLKLSNDPFPPPQIIISSANKGKQYLRPVFDFDYGRYKNSGIFPIICAPECANRLKLKQTESIINERVYKVEVSMGPDINGEEVTIDIPVVENPTSSQAINLAKKTEYNELRGLITMEGDLYFWDAGAVIHAEVQAELGLGPENHIPTHRLYIKFEPSKNVYLILNHSNIPSSFNKSKLDRLAQSKEIKYA
jgi:hypothetical protein